MKKHNATAWIWLNLALIGAGGAALAWGPLAFATAGIVALGLTGAALGGMLGWLTRETGRRRWSLVFHGLIVLTVAIATLIPMIRIGSLALPWESRETNFRRLVRALDTAYPYFEAKGIHWDTVVDRYAPQVSQAEDDGTYWRIVALMLAELNDGHTGLQSPSRYAGRTFFATCRDVDGAVVVDTVGMTAREAGIARGDIVQTVDGVPVEEALSTLSPILRAGATPQHQRAKAAFSILSTTSEQLVVTVDGEGGERTVTLVRPDAPPSPASGRGSERGEDAAAQPLITGERLPSGVGLIHIPTFSAGDHDLVAKFDAALEALMDAPGIILDLRGNDGGSSLIADEIAGRFLSRTFTYGRETYKTRLPIRGWRAHYDYRVRPRGETYAGALTLLIDAGNFSTAETFIVSLVDSGRATTVGRQTAGGSGNPIRFNLTGGGQVRFSTGDFRRNDGTAIEGVGITPDVEVAWTVETFRKERDPDLEVADQAMQARAARNQGLSQTELDRFFATQMRAQAIPGLAVVIANRDGIVYQGGFGTDGKGLPVTPETQLHIASLSKSFTALAIVQLVESGEVDLDAPVQRYLPDFHTADPAIGSTITVRQLLNQVSGLSEFGYDAGGLPSDADLATAIADLQHAMPTSAPGTTYAYFNPNYQLLGRIVEVVSGLSYNAYLETHIFDVLDMQRSFAANSQSEALARGEALSKGYLTPFGIPVRAAETPPILGPSGGLVSTAHDLGHYLTMHLNEGRYEGAELVTAKGQNMLVTPPGGGEGYAMGWYTQDAGAPVRIIEHGGSLDTYAARMVLLPEEGYGFALLTNHNHVLASMMTLPGLQEALIGYLTGAPLPSAPPSMRIIGAVIALLAAGTLTRQVIALTRMPQWLAKAGAWSSYKQISQTLRPYAGLLIVLLLPKLLEPIFERTVSLGIVFRLAPGLTGWLIATAALGACLGSARLVGWLIQRGSRLRLPGLTAFRRR